MSGGRSRDASLRRRPAFRRHDQHRQAAALAGRGPATGSGRSSAARRLALDRPMTICVMLLRFGVGSESRPSRSLALSRTVVAPRRSARRRQLLGAAQTPRSDDFPVARPEVEGDPVGLLRRRKRAAVRTTVSDKPSLPTQTSRRSAVGQGLRSPCWRSWASICSSTRSAVRRRASSRSAVRLLGLKNWSMARRAFSGR